MGSAWSELIGLIAPPRCGACGEPAPVDDPLCPGCATELAATAPLIEPGAGGADLKVAAAHFDGVARRIVHGIKYARRLSLARVAAAAMLDALPVPSPAFVVPVPAAGWRWRRRGFDPAEELAIAIADHAALELRPCLRRASGPRQVGRTRVERLAEPPRVRVAGDCPPEALLVDDVWTTGATLHSCAAALRTGGCARIVALTLAHAA